MSKDRLEYKESKYPISMMPVSIFFKLDDKYKVIKAYDYKTAKKAVNAVKRGILPQTRYKDC